jgi:hypothetical protein
VAMLSPCSEVQFNPPLSGLRGPSRLIVRVVRVQVELLSCDVFASRKLVTLEAKAEPLAADNSAGFAAEVCHCRKSKPVAVKISKEKRTDYSDVTVSRSK